MVRVDGKNITFTCTFNGNRQSYDFLAPAGKTATKLAMILKNHAGKTLFVAGVTELLDGCGCGRIMEQSRWVADATRSSRGVLDTG